MRISPAVAGLVSVLVACSSSSGGASDAGAQDVLGEIDSSCGQPGDKGNALGVGAFCENFHDCDGTADAHLCSIIGDSTTHFCTKTCPRPSDGGGDDGGGGDASADSGCGDGATCQCDPSGCGCTPNTCL